MGCPANTPVMPTPTDTNSNIYHLIGTVNQANIGTHLMVWAAYNIAGGANTVTQPNGQISNNFDWTIIEYSGIASSSALDVWADQTSTTPSISITTTNANDVLLDFINGGVTDLGNTVATLGTPNFAGGAVVIVQSLFNKDSSNEYMTAASPLFYHFTYTSDVVYNSAYGSFMNTSYMGYMLDPNGSTIPNAAITETLTQFFSGIYQIVIVPGSLVAGTTGVAGPTGPAGASMTSERLFLGYFTNGFDVGYASLGAAKYTSPVDGFLYTQADVLFYETEWVYTRNPGTPFTNGQINKPPMGITQSPGSDIYWFSSDVGPSSVAGHPPLDVTGATQVSVIVSRYDAGGAENLSNNGTVKVFVTCHR
jgi:hypothetical protein